MATTQELPKHVLETLAFYERHATINRRAYLAAKALQLVITASLTVVGVVPAGPIRTYQSVIIAVSGACLLIIEGMQQTMQLQQLWVKYRATHNALRREVMLLESCAGPYADVPTDSVLRLLAERIDALIGAEHSDWLNLQEKSIGKQDKS